MQRSTSSSSSDWKLKEELGLVVSLRLRNTLTFQMKILMRQSEESCLTIPMRWNSNGGPFVESIVFVCNSTSLNGPFIEGGWTKQCMAPWWPSQTYLLAICDTWRNRQIQLNSHKSTMHSSPPSTTLSTYHSLNLPLRKSLAGLLTLTSNDWSLLVVLVGTVTIWMLFFSNRDSAASVYCPLLAQTARLWWASTVMVHR